MFLLRLLVSIIVVLYCGSDRGDPLHAYSPGDIMIGGLFPIHLKTHPSTPNKVSCTDYDLQMFLRSQVMIYAIQEINQRRELPNITLGYDIYDTCGDVSLAIRATLQLLWNHSDPQSCPQPSNIFLPLPESQTKVLIGERYSEVSIAVARIATLSSLPQISYASTSELLSKKFKFPTFLRTVPSDAFQTEGISKLVSEFDWKTVAIVGSDDEYGKYGSDRLKENFIKMNICVEFVKILPGNFSKNSTELTDVIGRLNKSVAEGIILFTKDTNVEIILKAVIKNNLNQTTWIASDTWSTSPTITSIDGIELVGQVFGLIPNRNEVPCFKEYVSSMFHGNKNNILEHHKTLCSPYPNHFKQNEGNCCYKSTLNASCLAERVDQDESYSIYLAVRVVAEGLKSLLGCNNVSCERGTNFTTSELLKEIQKVNFTVNNTHLYFNDGDPSLGYDIVQWNTSTNVTRIETIAGYWPNVTFTIPAYIKKKMTTNVTVSGCSKTCDPGYMLKPRKEYCCFHCVACADGEFSEKNGEPCKPCNSMQYSMEGHRHKCLEKSEEFLRWSDPFSIILSFLAGVAIVFTLVLTVIFMIHRNTPIVKAVGGYLCFLELLSLLFSFCLIFTFFGKPTCKSSCVGIPLFGVAFSLCISCILANLLQILVGFNFDLKVGSWIKKLNQPLAVVIIISGIQLTLTVSWLVVNPLTPSYETERSTVLHQCNIEASAFFIAMIAYNGCLGTICFLFAVKGKQLPDLYKNASLITVSMVLFLIIWIVFLPLFITLKGKYRPAISGAAILISSASILCCHLAPKGHMMTFRKDLNNEKAIIEYIRRHYEQKGLPVVQS